jgi:hypothetical protein
MNQSKTTNLFQLKFFSRKELFAMLKIYPDLSNEMLRVFH